MEKRKNIIGHQKILFLSHYFPPECNAPASRVYEMTKVWVEQGHDVTVITCTPNCPNGIVYEGYKNKLVQKEVVNGIKVVRIWTYIAANRGKRRRIVNYVTYMFSAVLAALWVRKPDVVIATSPQFFCGWAGVLLSKLKRVPFILEIRDIWPDSIVAVGAIKNKLVLRSLEKLERIMYASATHIVTVGSGYRDKLVEKGVGPEKISIVSNGVNMQMFRPCPHDSSLRKKYGIDGEFVCAFVGTLGMASGLDIVLEAAKRLKDRALDQIKFMLIGDGALREELQKKMDRLGLDNIVFTGRLAKHVMPRYLASADSCLIHLKKTALFQSVLPSKMFEAAAMERPIILGVEGSAAELVEDAQAGICIEPENANELVNAIIKLANDRELAQRYGLAGRRYVETHFDRKVLACNYLEKIQLILAKYSAAYARDGIQHAREIRQGMRRKQPSQSVTYDAKVVIQTEQSMRERLQRPTGRTRNRDTLHETV